MSPLSKRGHIRALQKFSAISRAFDNDNPAFSDRNRRGRENKFIDSICAISEQMRCADPKRQMNVV